MHTYSTHPPLYLQNKQICKYTTLSTHLSLSILMIACCLMSFSRSCGRMHACHMRRRIHADDCMLSHVIWGGGYMLSDIIWGGWYILMIACCLMSYEEEDTCCLMSYEEEDTFSWLHAVSCHFLGPVPPFPPSTSVKEEDTCMSYEEEDTCLCRPFFLPLGLQTLLLQPPTF
jgi:hypothetical protein